MSGKEELFATMDSTNKSKIKSGDQKALQVEVMGTMEVTKNEGIKKIKNIYYTPNIKHNFLSIGQMMEKNYKLIFEDGKCIIFHKKICNRVVTQVPMKKNRLFPLNFGEKRGSQLDNLSIENTSVLWHLRYGNLNYASMKLLTYQAMVCGIPKVKEHKEVCEGYALGKHSRTKFPRGEGMERKPSTSIGTFKYLWSNANPNHG